jgi:hypothetical protein
MALALAAGTWIFSTLPGLADDAKPAPAPAPKPKAESSAEPSEKNDETSSPSEPRTKGPTVKLQLRIGGLRSQGCDVEVKPGNAACRFKKQTRHVEANGETTLVFRDVETRTVDRNCTFAITVREQGQAPKTVYRGFRMVADPSKSASGEPQSFTCFMSAPSKVAGLEREGRTIR